MLENKSQRPLVEPTQEAQQSGEGFYQSLFENASYGSFALDQDRVFLAINKAGLQMLGIETSQELIGKVKLSDLLDSDNNVLVTLGEIRKLSGCDEISFFYRRNCQPSSAIPLRLTSIFDAEGNFQYIHAIFLEPTKPPNFGEGDILKIEQEIVKKVTEDFFRSMSHEIRTPLNAIVGMTDLLETTHLNLKQKTYIGYLKDASKRLLNLINERIR